MFFSPGSVKNTFAICWHNNNLHTSKGVLHGRNRARWHQPCVNIEFREVWSCVVLYNIEKPDKFAQRSDAFLLLLMMQPPTLPIVLHVCAIVFPPVLLAFLALLSICRIFGHFLAVVVSAPSSLTAGSITNLLIGMVGRRQEALSAVGTCFFCHVFKLADRQ